jgi:hypothetical protein
MPTGPPNEEYFENFPKIGEELERLRRYQKGREEEEEAVRVILAKPASERTEREWRVLSYSPFGFASKCG